MAAVVLAAPGDELLDDGDPNARLMLAPISLPAIQEQARGIADAFRACGIRVHICRPTRRPPPNFLFMRDLFFMTPEGAVLGRMGASQRAGEERFAAAALAAIGIPILGMPRGNATVEGADVLWARKDLVLIGIGRRTNPAGADFVASLLSAMKVETRTVRLPEGAQHLLGVVNFVSETLAVVRSDHVSRTLLRTLHSIGVKELALEPSAEVVERRAMGFVCIGPMKVIMPSDCPVIRRTFEERGIEVLEVCVTEYVKAAGSLACLAGILRREGECERRRSR